MNRKGFLRIVEATIAIIIILGVLFVFFSRTQELKEPNLSEKARDILDEMSRNSTLRENILDSSAGVIPSSINNFIDQRVFENYLEYEVRICEIDEACGIEYKPVNVYSAERSISSTIETLGPKKIRLFIWEAG